MRTAASHATTTPDGLGSSAYAEPTAARSAGSIRAALLAMDAQLASMNAQISALRAQLALLEYAERSGPVRLARPPALLEDADASDLGSANAPDVGVQPAAPPPHPERAVAERPAAAARPEETPIAGGPPSADDPPAASGRDDVTAGVVPAPAPGGNSEEIPARAASGSGAEPPCQTPDTCPPAPILVPEAPAGSSRKLEEHFFDALAHYAGLEGGLLPSNREIAARAAVTAGRDLTEDNAGSYMTILKRKGRIIVEWTKAGRFIRIPGMTAAAAPAAAAPVPAPDDGPERIDGNALAAWLKQNTVHHVVRLPGERWWANGRECRPEEILALANTKRGSLGLRPFVLAAIEEAA